MTTIKKLRDDIERAITLFIQNNPNLSPERQQEISRIRELLAHNNPLKVKARLDEYINTLSTGFISIFSFLEVNRFKNALQQVLNSPAYQENAILKAMVLEAGIQLNQDDIVNLDKNILSRVEKLERALGTQQDEIGTLQQQIKRLKEENQFLHKNMAKLSDANKELKIENRTIKEAKVRVDKEVKDLKQQYEVLLAENTALKNKAFGITPSNEASKQTHKVGFFTDPTSTQGKKLTSCRETEALVSTSQNRHQMKNKSDFVRVAVKG